jgi:hypothetical protein
MAGSPSRTVCNRESWNSAHPAVPAPERIEVRFRPKPAQKSCDCVQARTSLHRMFSPFRATNFRSRIAALAITVLVLFGLLNGGGGIAVVAAWMAASAGQHEVSLGVNEEHFTLILSHDHAQPARSASHRHGLASRLATLFAETDIRPNGDHILHFDRLEIGTSAAARVEIDKPAAIPLIVAACRQESPRFTPALTHALRDRTKHRGYWPEISFGCSTIRLI